MTAPTTPVIARTVVEAVFFREAASGDDLLCVELSCGHWQFLATLPNGFPSTEALCDATFGCPTCGIEGVAA